MPQLESIRHWLSVMAPSQLVEAKDLPEELLAATPLAAGVGSEPAVAPVPLSTVAPALPSFGDGPDARVTEIVREARRLHPDGEPSV